MAAQATAPRTDRHGRTVPTLIQGGMGVAVSSWQLAREVSKAGQLGVVSGTALDAVVARRLQDGDPGGHYRRALAAFPIPEVAEKVLKDYFVEGGKAADAAYKPVPKPGLRQDPRLVRLSVVGNFAEVWLAKEGHDGLVGINFLEKIQMATPAAAYGAVLAEADYVLMGAGIPSEIPQLLTDLANHERAGIDLDVAGNTQNYRAEIDPAEILGVKLEPVRRPNFLAIISSHILAMFLYRDEVTRPDGFVVEGPVAGGHNTPPRGKLQLDEHGQPVFGPRDDADLAKVAAVGLPFWLAGGHAGPQAVKDALAAGASGVQIGTLFALSKESGLRPDLRDRAIRDLITGDLVVRTDAKASPTGFPFKVVQMEDTVSDADSYDTRDRICDLGYLRQPYEVRPGKVGYRCASEPVDIFVSKGGQESEAEGRRCLCNGLLATTDAAQVRDDGYVEAPIVTLGGDLNGARELLQLTGGGYTARQAVEWLLS